VGCQLNSDQIIVLFFTVFEASDFLCIQTTPFWREFSNKKSAKKHALSDALLKSHFLKFAASGAFAASSAKKLRCARVFEGLN